MTEQTFTQEEIAAMLQKAKISAEIGIIESAKAQITTSLEYSIRVSVQEVVQAFLDEEIVPAIQAELKASQGVIVQEAIVAAHEMATMLATKMAEVLSVNLASDYRAKEIFKAMFA